MNRLTEYKLVTIMLNTIIFDVDGTLIDTRPGIINAVQFVIDKYKLKQLNSEEFNRFVGFSPIQAAFHHFCGTDEEMSQICSQEYRAKYKQGDVFNAKVYNGIFELLDFLKQKKYKLGIATYKRQDNIDEIAEYFGLCKYFDSICGADNNNKLTKSDIINNCIKSMDADKNYAVMIGDSIHDAGAANNLSIKFIGVTYGFGFKTQNDVNEYSNILSANTPLEILDFFKKEY